jgi:hypothetical protein
MVQTIAISDNITLKDLRQSFGLQRNETPQFFPEWTVTLPELSPVDQMFLERVRNRYLYQLDEGALLEEGVKLMIMSPLLDIAGFYDPPFKTRFEVPVKITVETTDEVLQGRIDALVIQEQFWVWVLEAKRTTFSLSLGIPQALSYMLANPQPDTLTFGILMSGEDFIFIKLVQQPSPTYGLSRKFSLLNPGDLAEVLKIMRSLGQQIMVDSL